MMAMMAMKVLRCVVDDYKDTSNQTIESVITDLNNPRDTSILQPTHPCDFCSKIFQTKAEKISHSVNSHPGKPTDADPELLKLVKEGA